ncbi:MAG: PCYCGC motif-containing (lipo)protein [Tumebacillaceae bacterium]
MSATPATITLAANQQMEPGGDILETTASYTALPSFLKNADPKIVQAYQVAAKNLELLQSMPCYCGCGESVGHTSNASCFVKGKTSDGKIIWDDHGTKCDTCMEIAVTSAKMKQEGKTTLEIRNFIDNKYKEGYAKPTPTPMPSKS